LDELSRGLLLEPGRTYRITPGERLTLWHLERNGHVYERWIEVFPE
jgi:hypothetical protein